MTLTRHSSLKCPLCGKISRYEIFLSSNQVRLPDLDTRPGPLFRDTMPTWAQQCPACGYVARKMTDAPVVDAAFIQTQAYLTCDGFSFESELAKKFYRLYLTLKRANDARNAFWSALQAAWASDDKEDREGAVYARKRALEQLDLFLQKSDEPHENLKMIAVDILRRIGEFEQALERLERSTFTDELLVKIADVENRLCQKKDDDCYSVERAFAIFGIERDIGN